MFKKLTYQSIGLLFFLILQSHFLIGENWHNSTPTPITDSLWNQVKTLVVKGELNDAISASDLLITKAIQEENTSILAKTYNAKGVIYKKLGQFKEAQHNFNISLNYKFLLNDSVEIAKTYNNLANLYHAFNYYDSSIFYIQKSIEIAKTLEDSTIIASSLITLGIQFFQLGEYQKAINEYSKAKKLKEIRKDTAGIIITYQNIGACYHKLGLYHLAVENFFTGLGLAQEAGVRESEALILQNIAQTLTVQKNYQDAKRYYLKSQEIYQKENQLLKVADINLGIGEIFLFENSPTQAIETLQKCQKTFLDFDRKYYLAYTYHAFGKAYNQLGEYEKAFAFFTKSIALNKEVNNELNLGETYLSLAKGKFENNQYQEALDHFLAAKPISNNQDNLLIQKQVLLGLSETYAALGDSLLSYKYYKEYVVTNDSIFTIEKNRQIQELREIYESAEKDEKIKQLQLKNQLIALERERNLAVAEQQKSQRNSLLVVVLAIAGLFVAAFIYYRQRLVLLRVKAEEESKQHQIEVKDLLSQQETKALQKTIESKDQERKRIAKELHDHFGSMLAAIRVNLSNMQAQQQAPSEQVITMVDKACQDVRSLSHSLNVGIASNFGLIPALKELTESLNQGENLSVKFTASFYNHQADSNTEIIIYRMIQELISNALKHAEASKITIQLTCIDHLLNIIVEDNGKGFNPATLPPQAKGIGLNSLQERITTLKGELIIDSHIGRGTTMIIDLPLPPQEK